MLRISSDLVSDITYVGYAKHPLLIVAVAQDVRRLTVESGVPGSNPSNVVSDFFQY